VGKTNILSAIKLLKKVKPTGKIFKSNIRNYDYPVSIFHLEFLFDQRKIKAKFHIVLDIDERNSDEIIDSKIEFYFYEITKSKKWVELPLEAFYYERKYFKVIGKGLSVYNNRVNSIELDIMIEVIRYINNISYYSASQFSDPSKSAISFEISDKVSPSSRINNGTNPHEKFLKDLFRAFNENKKLFNQFLNIVGKDGIALIDDWTFNEYDMPYRDYKVSSGIIKPIEKNRQLVVPYITIDNISLSPNQLSEGTFKTLALIFYILADENDLLLIEEPEVCVHHGLLNNILNLIVRQSLNKQILISSHSDYVLDKLKPENILLINKEKGVGTTARTLPNALSSQEYKALKIYLDESGNLGEYWKTGGLDNG
jgi:predicted ATP-dependent endonuclease of OLD family